MVSEVETYEVFWKVMFEVAGISDSPSASILCELL
jgi:hypothetical protein